MLVEVVAVVVVRLAASENGFKGQTGKNVLIARSFWLRSLVARWLNLSATTAAAEGLRVMLAIGSFHSDHRNHGAGAIDNRIHEAYTQTFGMAAEHLLPSCSGLCTFLFGKESQSSEIQKLFSTGLHSSVSLV